MLTAPKGYNIDILYALRPIYYTIHVCVTSLLCFVVETDIYTSVINPTLRNISLKLVLVYDDLASLYIYNDTKKVYHPN